MIVGYILVVNEYFEIHSRQVENNCFGVIQFLSFLYNFIAHDIRYNWE